MTLPIILIALVLNSLFCLGVQILLTGENMVFKQLGDWITLHSQDYYWITKPFYNCLPCMASVYGFSLFIFMFGFTWAVLPYCIALCGLNSLVSKLYYYES
jgi:hypothetical protein